MKFAFAIGVLTALMLTGCFSQSHNVLESAPDYITSDSLHNSVQVVAARPLIHAGKIISFGNFLFINEPFQGWHVIDNSTPSAPNNVAFITAPGSLDGATAGATLYINNSVDLVVLDISDPAHATVVRRLEQVVPIPRPPHAPAAGLDPNEPPIIGWHDTVVNVTTYPMG